jgi:hypothetical protein
MGARIAELAFSGRYRENSALPAQAGVVKHLLSTAQQQTHHQTQSVPFSLERNAVRTRN